MDRAMELRHLDQADRLQREGQARVDAQADLLARLKTQGAETHRAEALLHLLNSTLLEYHRHRDMIIAKLSE